MNVFQCKNGVIPKGADGDKIKITSECIFRITRMEHGNVVTHGCVLHACKEGHDYYNLYPELEGFQAHGPRQDGKPAVPVTGQATAERSMLVYNTDGKVLYQPSNRTDPYKLGAEFGEENLTEHNSGKSFDFRSFDADINPKYHRIDFNVPTKHILGDEDVGEIMGDENPALVHPSWNTEKFEGISSVEVCRNAIYGRYNPDDNIVFHVCMKSHIGLPNWINYTNTVMDVKPADLYVGFASDDEISSFAHDCFKNWTVAERVAEALIFVKNGGYVNFWSLLKNNFIPKKSITDFTRRINTESIDSIYKKNAFGSRDGLENYVKLYFMLDKMQWKDEVIDEEGNTKVDLMKIPDDYLHRYRENILNWVLNHPMLKKVSLEEKKYRPEERYWFIIPLLKRALKDGTLNKTVLLPQWMISMLKKPNPSVKVFRETKRYNELSEELKGEYHDAQIMQLDNMSASSSDNINRQYPGMRVIRNELPANLLREADLMVIGNEDGEKNGWKQFTELLHLGKRWSMLEIKNAFEHFVPSWSQNAPFIFYDWLEKIAESPIEPTYSLTKDEFDEIIKRTGGIVEDYPDDEIEMIQEGALYHNLGDGDLSMGDGQGVIFARNILDASLFDKDDNGDTIIWNSWADFDSVKMPIGNWFEASGRVRSHRECQHETFYTMLAATRALKADDEFAKKFLSDESYREVKESSENNTATLRSIVECGIDEENFKWIDPSSGDRGFLNEGKEGLWLGEE